MRVVAGEARSIPLEAPKGDGTRPTTDRIKETLFNILGPEIAGSRFLDLFAGSGQMGIEALSRGAKEAVFIEKNKKVLPIIERNLTKTKFSDCSKVISGDVLNSFSSLSGTFDYIFADPPYASDIYASVLQAVGEKNLLSPKGILITECSMDFSEEELSSEELILYRVKEYKTNKHLFYRRKDD